MQKKRGTVRAGRPRPFISEGGGIRCPWAVKKDAIKTTRPGFIPRPKKASRRTKINRLLVN
jgi:hypothetical protein